MNLSKNNYTKTEATFRDHFSGDTNPGMIYSYESKDKLYDVTVVKGMKEHRLNCGHSLRTKIHEAIEKHFNL